MFLTDLEDFDYKPYFKDGELVRGKVVTQAALLWDSKEEGKIVVQPGFVTDLASLPWFVMWLLTKLGKHQRAAVLHDFLTRSQIGGFVWAAKEFEKAMKQDGVAWYRRAAIISGLLAGGYLAWKNPQPVVII